jgi:hypothetical protein
VPERAREDVFRRPRVRENDVFTAVEKLRLKRSRRGRIEGRHVPIKRFEGLRLAAGPECGAEILLATVDLVLQGEFEEVEREVVSRVERAVRELGQEPGDLRRFRRS